MSEHAPEKILSDINVPKILAGALAAVCAAVVGSFLGVAGTLIGAAVASVVGSVGTEIYERSLKHGAHKLQTLAPTFIKAPAAVGTPAVAAATSEDDLPSHTLPEQARSQQIRWGHVAAAAGAVFVLAMAGIWLAEKALGEPIAAAVGASGNTSGTTLGNVGKSPRATPQPAPANTPTAGPPSGANNAPAAPTPSTAATTTSPAGTTTTAPTGATPTTGQPAQGANPGTNPGGGGSVGFGGGSVGSGGAAGGAVISSQGSG
ncbi:MAG: hypothetical protein QOH97_4316 [Actinoplanes sp.]|jgi:uncharacterized membrane protein YgcG|nr:hypothetical protein [Actinoplanes sp.]